VVDGALQFWRQVAQQVVIRLARHAVPPPVRGGWLSANTVGLLGETSLSSCDKVCRCRGDSCRFSGECTL
jgi:hypothetical protein